MFRGPVVLWSMKRNVAHEGRLVTNNCGKFKSCNTFAVNGKGRLLHASLFFTYTGLRSFPGTVNELITFQYHEESTQASFYWVSMRMKCRKKKECASLSTYLAYLGRFLQRCQEAHKMKMHCIIARYLNTAFPMLMHYRSSQLNDT